MLPRVQPIALVQMKDPFDDPEWLFDFKHDGFRALCYLEHGEIDDHLHEQPCISENIAELWPAGFGGCDDLSVENCVVHMKRSCNLLAEAGKPAHQVAVARDQTTEDVLQVPPALNERQPSHIGAVEPDQPKGPSIIFAALPITGTGHKLFELMWRTTSKALSPSA